MSMRLRRGGGIASVPPPPTADFGPSVGAQAVRDNAGALSVATPGGGVGFSTIAGLSTAIEANPANTVFVATANSYTITSQLTWTAGLHPRIYFPGPPGTRIISGGGSNINGISVPAGGVEIYGGTFTGFGNISSTFQSGVMVRGPSTLSNVIFSGCYRGVGHGGISGDGTNGFLTVSHCEFTDCWLAGIVPSHNDGLKVLFEFNELSGNNAGSFNPGGTASGAKILHNNDSSIYRNNWCHDNNAWGMWWDSSEGPHDIYDNVVERNARAGIFFERSDSTGASTTLHHNYTTGNSAGGTIGGQTATEANSYGINIRNSDNVEVYNNDIDEARYTFLVGCVDSGDVPPTGLNIHDNRIWLRASNSKTGGLDSHVPENGLFTTPITWNTNTYKVLSLSGTYWQWGSGEVANTFTTWQSTYGFDAAGTREVI